MTNDLTPEQQARVDEIRLALEQELRENANSATSRAAIKDLEEVKEDALRAIQTTLKFSQNESLKSKVAMWAYDRLIAEGKTSSDPLAEMMAGMERVRREADAASS